MQQYGIKLLGMKDYPDGYSANHASSMGIAANTAILEAENLEIFIGNP